MIIDSDLLDGVLLIKPGVHKDKRGFFMEIFHAERYTKSGIDVQFQQDNLSFSVQGTLRGLHYQYPKSQAKLIQIISGRIFNVVVDIRRGSPNFGQWAGFYLNEEEKNQLFIPEGFANGFCVISKTAVFIYKCSNYYAPDCEAGINWRDPDLNIQWPVEDPILSERDQNLPFLRKIELKRLPQQMEMNKQ